MIVLDASVVVELLLNGRLADRVRSHLNGRSEFILVPHLLDVEVTSAFRRLTAGRQVDAHGVSRFFSGLAAMPLERYPHTPLLGRVWELRRNFTAYDAVYIALAEATDSVLYTCDAKMASGHRARVVLVTD